MDRKVPKMSAVRLHVVVPEDRQLTVRLPQQVKPGDAEMIILTPAGKGGAAALLDLVDAWRAANPARRSREDIDGDLAEDRTSWGRGDEGLPR